jgi:hypothetical protein
VQKKLSGNSVSGKFVLRLPPEQHAALQDLAGATGVSLNTLCRQALTEFLGRTLWKTGTENPEEPLLRSLRQMFDTSLLGVLLFGSVARGEEHDGSDIDLLIVIARERPLARLLYRQWDEAWPTGAYSPHFVHLPDSIEKAGSVWLEAAVDGVILFEGDGSVRRFLGQLRKAMAVGRLVRRTAYDDPYWIKGYQGPSANNDALRRDSLRRAGARLQALAVLQAAGSWADVVREAQEVVEISLKGLLRAYRIEVPRIHDVSPVLKENRERLPMSIREQLPELMHISRSLRRDRELAFYGSEDLTPSEFYTEEDAATALAQATRVHEAVSKAVGAMGGGGTGRNGAADR